MTQQGFTTTQVIKLTGINPKTLHYWAQTEFISPSIARAHGTGSRRIWSFRDILALRTAHELRSQDVPLQRIRLALNYLQTVEGLENPLAGARLVVSGDDVLVVRGNRELVSILHQPGQSALKLVLDLERIVKDTKRAVKEVEQAA